ncbi:MAG: hypothetical protein Q8S84_04045 [bacterium]|nr:hypothetical protein [bacterium]MDP3380678.1 hypothetical protein [bacterium]
MIKLCKKEKALFLQVEAINFSSSQASPLEEKEQEQKVFKK